MSHPNILDRIAAATRARIARAKSVEPVALLHARFSNYLPPRDFAAPFGAPGVRVIAEIKRASPSAGRLTGLEPALIARAYADNGAAALSVLTEPDFFGGDIKHLALARSAAGLPLLMKDFFLEEYQLAQARAYGADCVLLIVALLGAEGLKPMLAAARGLGLSALVEVHTEEELENAFASGAELIGVNNRDLKMLTVDLDVARRLARAANGRRAVLICESGLSRREELEELAALGYGGFLIGTSLIKSGDPGRALARLLGREPKT